jgi:hypothetical protein
MSKANPVPHHRIRLPRHDSSCSPKRQRLIRPNRCGSVPLRLGYGSGHGLEECSQLVPGKAPFTAEGAPCTSSGFAGSERCTSGPLSGEKWSRKTPVGWAERLIERRNCLVVVVVDDHVTGDHDGLGVSRMLAARALHDRQYPPSLDARRSSVPGLGAAVRCAGRCVGSWRNRDRLRTRR